MTTNLSINQEIVIHDTYENTFRVCSVQEIGHSFVVVEWLGKEGRKRKAQYPIEDLGTDYIVYAKVHST